MTERLEVIFSAIPECEIFADIGCDHGYVTARMLKSEKCKKAIISDISEKCLQKAQKLLSVYAQSGSVESVVSDGFTNISYADVALIAGMGGEEIIKIISNCKKEMLPQTLVLQPMRNVDKLRRALVKNGYKILLDYVFFANGKFYDLIKCEKGRDILTADEIEFGRTNVANPNQAFVKRLRLELEKKQAVIAENRLNEERREEYILEIERIKKYV